MAEPDDWIEQEVARSEHAQRVMMHPGVGLLTAPGPVPRPGAVERSDGSILYLVFVSPERVSVNCCRLIRTLLGTSISSMREGKKSRLSSEVRCLAKIRMGP